MRAILSRWFGGNPHTDSAHDLKHPPRSKRHGKLDARIRSLRLMPVPLAEKLASAGVVTCRDLLELSLGDFATSHGLPHRQCCRLRDARRALRLALAVRGLRPSEASLLVAIHRHHPQNLATDSPRRVFRDLHRFALSSSGEQMTRHLPLPTMEQVRAWIASAKKRTIRETSSS